VVTQPAFGARLRAAVAARGPLVVGIDPHLPLLRDWGLPEDVSGLERFALTAVEAVAGRVAVVKPQSAFFERFGSRGIAVLERVLAAIRAAGALSLLDVKRGDIGSTMVGYAGAYLDPASPLAADAITASPYLGFGSLRPLFDAAYTNGRGVFVLALTSNPEGPTVQRAVAADGRTVAQTILDGVAAANAAEGGPLGSVGAVVGATVGEHGHRLDHLRGPVLAPGLGAQGAGPADLPAVFGAALPLVLPAASREVLGAGPDPVRLRATTDRIAAEVMAIRTSTMAGSGR
jgi:orotidine-5'-phosphate decarboxylase